MSVGSINLNDIDRAISSGAAAVESLRTWVRGSEAYRICDQRERDVRDGAAAMTKLVREWPRIQALLSASAREYDAYVTRPDEGPQGCSCHLSAPCSWCVGQVEEEEPQQ